MKPKSRSPSRSPRRARKAKPVTNNPVQVAADVMTHGVVTIHVDASLVDLAKSLRTHGISGMPVVNDDGDVLGVVSLMDVVNLQSHNYPAPGRRSGSAKSSQRDGLAQRDAWYYYHLGELDTFIKLGLMGDECLDVHVRDIYTPFVIAVGPWTPLSEVAQQFVKYHIHRVLVLNDKQLLGIISTLDVIPALLAPVHASGLPATVRV